MRAFRLTLQAVLIESDFSNRRRWRTAPPRGYLRRRCRVSALREFSCLAAAYSSPNDPRRRYTSDSEHLELLWSVTEVQLLSASSLAAKKGNSSAKGHESAIAAMHQAKWNALSATAQASFPPFATLPCNTYDMSRCHDSRG